MLTLYQFPISHFCEKARWALDYKQIDYRLHNLLPGLHALKTTKLAAQSSVPLLVDGGQVIQGSAAIITYLDEKFPQASLTPEDPLLKQEALEWERYLDREIGVHVRRCCYQILLEHPHIVIGFFSQDGPWYGRLFIRAMFPKLKAKMRAGMNINADSADESRHILGKAIDRVHTHLQKHDFLVGTQFTRADLTAAALLAPLCMPAKYGLRWPAEIPPELQALIAAFEERIAWVGRCYERHR